MSMIRADKLCADAIARELEWLDVYAPLAAEEARRTLNLGCPLADMLRAGMVARVTDHGRDHLHSTAADLAAMHEVIAWDASYATPRLHYLSHNGETVESWIPLWDAMREVTPRFGSGWQAANSA